MEELTFMFTREVFRSLHIQHRPKVLAMLPQLNRSLEPRLLFLIHLYAFIFAERSQAALFLGGACLVDKVKYEVLVDHLFVFLTDLLYLFLIQREELCVDHPLALLHQPIHF